MAEHAVWLDLLGYGIPLTDDPWTLAQSDKVRHASLTMSSGVQLFIDCWPFMNLGQTSWIHAGLCREAVKVATAQVGTRKT